MWEDYIKPIVIFLLLCFTAVFCVIGVIYIVEFNFVEANQIKVFVDNEKVYEGKSAFVNISSGGYATTVKIYDRLFPILHKIKTYTSKHVPKITIDRDGK